MDLKKRKKEQFHQKSYLSDDEIEHFYGQKSSLSIAGIKKSVHLNHDKASSTADSTVKKDVRQFPLDNKSLRYPVYKEIGRGGMCKIFEALDRDLNRNVALKILIDDSDPRWKRRLIEEAQITGQLEHPNIVPVHELGINRDGSLFITMKLIKGISLKEVFDQLAQLGPNEKSQYKLGKLLNIFLNVCNAIAFAHYRGVIHRDLKPSNIMLGDFGEVLVMDWGLAKAIGIGRDKRKKQSRLTKEDDNDDLDTQLDLADKKYSQRFSMLQTQMIAEDDTLDGVVLGTPAYISPEQARGEIGNIDEQSDIYALGAILYEMVTHKRPVEKKDVREMLLEISCGVMIPPDQRVPDRNIPKELVAIINKAMSPKKEHRYSDVRQLQRDIQLFLDNREVSVKSDTTWETIVKLVKRNPISSMVTGVATAILVVVIAVSLEVNISARRKTEKAFSNYVREQKARSAMIKKDKEERTPVWTLVLEENFSDTGWKKNFDIIYGRYVTGNNDASFTTTEPDYEHRNSALCLRDGTPQILALKESMKGNIAVEFECWQTSDYLNSIGCFFDGVWPVDPKNVAFSGYRVEYGGYDNCKNFITRGGQTIWEENDNPLIKNCLYKIRVERQDKQIRLFVDGQIVADVTDDSQIYGTYQGAVGLFSYATHVWFDNVRVYKMGPAIKEDLLDVADRYVHQNDYATAERIYTAIKQTSVDSVRLAKADAGLKRIKNIIDLREKLPQIARKLKKEMFENAPLLNVVDGGLSLDMPGFYNLQSIEPLRGLPLAQLNMTECFRVKSLEPLRGMPLKNLNLSFTGMYKNLYPIENAPIEKLIINYSTMENLSSLGSLPLRYLEVCYSNCQNWEFLSELKLNTLKMACSDLSDLSLLHSMPLKEIDLYNCNVKDIGILENMPVSQCNLGYNPFSDLTPLKDKPIRSLNISETDVNDLSSLNTFALRELKCAKTSVKNISLLSEAPNLEVLDISFTPITNIASLNKVRLKEFRMDFCSIRNCRPIAAMPLNKLGFEGVPLTQENVSLLMGLNVRELTISLLDSASLLVVDSLKKTGYINGHKRDYVVKIMNALQDTTTYTKMRSPLYFLGEETNVNRYLAVPVRMTWNDALAFSKKHGGTLATAPSSPEIYYLKYYLNPLCQTGTRYHLGMKTDPAQKKLVNTKGEEIEYERWISSYVRTQTMEKKQPSTLTFRARMNDYKWEPLGKIDKAYFVIAWDKE